VLVHEVGRRACRDLPLAVLVPFEVVEVLDVAH
jgi:hypothetical protein